MSAVELTRTGRFWNHCSIRISAGDNLSSLSIRLDVRGFRSRTDSQLSKPLDYYRD